MLSLIKQTLFGFIGLLKATAEATKVSTSPIHAGFARQIHEIVQSRVMAGACRVIFSSSSRHADHNMHLQTKYSNTLLGGYKTYLNLKSVN